MNINTLGDYVLVVCPNPSVDIYAWSDEINIGTTNRIVKEERYPGGKGVHVAMALAELGIDVVLAGIWGGLTGQWIKTGCNRYYPQIKIIGPELEEWSRSCYTFRSKSDNNDTELIGAGPEISEGDYFVFLTLLKEHLPQAKAVVLSGSWPVGAHEDAYAQIIEYAKSNSLPSFIDCTGRQLEEALTMQPYCIHLNRKESESFSAIGNFDKAIDLISQRCEVAAITDGAKGLNYITDGNRLHSLVKVSNVISTIGSGDCLLAGIVAGHIKELEAQSIANLGAACGAANCIRPELGMLHNSDVEKLLQMM